MEFEAISIVDNFDDTIFVTKSRRLVKNPTNLLRARKILGHELDSGTMQTPALMK